MHVYEFKLASSGHENGEICIMIHGFSYAPAFLQLKIKPLYLFLYTDCLQANNLVEYLRQNTPGLMPRKSSWSGSELIIRVEYMNEVQGTEYECA